jgi:hypothetical protein
MRREFSCLVLSHQPCAVSADGYLEAGNLGISNKKKSLKVEL